MMKRPIHVLLLVAALSLLICFSCSTGKKQIVRWVLGDSVPELAWQIRPGDQPWYAHASQSSVLPGSEESCPVLIDLYAYGPKHRIFRAEFRVNLNDCDMKQFQVVDVIFRQYGDLLDNRDSAPTDAGFETSRRIHEQTDMLTVKISSSSLEKFARRFSTTPCGSLLDWEMELEWLPASSKVFSSESARNHVENLSACEHNDWQIPSAGQVAGLFWSTSRWVQTPDGKLMIQSQNWLAREFAIKGCCAWQVSDSAKELAAYDFHAGSLNQTFAGESQRHQVLAVRFHPIDPDRRKFRYTPVQEETKPAASSDSEK